MGILDVRHVATTRCGSGLWGGHGWGWGGRVPSFAMRGLWLMRNCMAAVVSRTLRVSGRSAANASSDVVALAKTTRAVVAARYCASGKVAAGCLCYVEEGSE